jgi:hypothetical protein
VWPIFLLVGVEQVRIDPGNTAFTPLDFSYYPWTHSLVMAIAWSATVAAGSALVVRHLGAQLLLGGLVLSHWVLDFIVHRPDLPLWPGASPKVGLGLWNSVGGTIVVEGALLVAGLWLYVRTTRSQDRTGWYGFWGLMVLYVVLWLSNLLTAPPDTRSLAYFALASWLLPVWAWWADRHRVRMTRPTSDAG